jgi:hypothetical protein
MNFDRSAPSPANHFQSAHADLLLASYRNLLGKELFETSATDLGLALYEAPLVVLAHDTATDPVFFYGNLAAQRLFEMDWETLVQLASRLSAEPLAREERQRLLDLVARQGFIDNYSGVRIAKSGKRFLIEAATVWNLSGPDGRTVGQAAAFANWSPQPASASTLSSRLGPLRR